MPDIPRASSRPWFRMAPTLAPATRTRVPEPLHGEEETESSPARTSIHASAAERVYAEPESKPQTQAPLRAVFDRTLIAATIEAAFAAMLGTALSAMVASGSPQGRTSLAQGIYGSVGTSAVIVSTMLSGALYEAGRSLPFWFFAGTVALTFVLGLIVYTGFFGRWTRRRAASVAEVEAGA